MRNYFTSRSGSYAASCFLSFRFSAKGRTTPRRSIGSTQHDYKPDSDTTENLSLLLLTKLCPQHPVFSSSYPVMCPQGGVVTVCGLTNGRVVSCMSYSLNPRSQERLTHKLLHPPLHDTATNKQLNTLWNVAERWSGGRTGLNEPQTATRLQGASTSHNSDYYSYNHSSFCSIISQMSSCCQNNSLLSEDWSACAHKRFAPMNSHNRFHIWVKSYRCEHSCAGMER